MADERREVGPERQRLQRLDVLLAVGPGLVLVEGADDVVAGDRLDPAEEVAASTPSTWTVDSEQEPSITVVTPWRSDSDSDGPLSTSTS